MTNTKNYDEFDNQLISQIVSAQTAKREERQAFMLANYPWLQNVRATQIKLNESEAN
jgi:hypothetical protein